MVDLQPMQEHDIPSGMQLKTDAGWNQKPEDWLLFLALHPQGCFVARHEGQVIGTVTTIRYGDVLGWIGMLLVAPAFRRQGIGARLVEQAIRSLDGCAFIGLDATPAGLSLYERLGFQPAAQLVRVTADPLPEQPPAPRGSAPIDAATLAYVADLDRPIFGADRRQLLHTLWQRNKSLARAAGGGFCLGRQGTHYTQLGPLIARTADDAVLLGRCILPSLAGTAVALDVPVRQAAFLDWLQKAGFSIQRPLTRMLLGAGHMPGLIEYQFSIAGPEVG